MKVKDFFIPGSITSHINCLFIWDSVRNFVLDGTEASNEPIEGRLRDIRNYCLLIGALIKESRELNAGK